MPQSHSNRAKGPHQQVRERKGNRCCASQSMANPGGKARDPECVHVFIHSFIHSPNKYWKAGAGLHAEDSVEQNEPSHCPQGGDTGKEQVTHINMQLQLA